MQVSIVNWHTMSTTTQGEPYDVVVIGAGASGTALFYTLARYTTLRRVALVEKYATPGEVNSHARNNSQTLHIGDIETNYSIEKVSEVAPAASMVARYAEELPEETKRRIVFPVSKMVLGVGDEEVRLLSERYGKLKEIFPHIQKLERKDIALHEPLIVEGRKEEEPILALQHDGLAVDYQRLAESFLTETKRYTAGRAFDTYFNSPLETIEKHGDLYHLQLRGGTTLVTHVVVFNADAYSLLFAKRLGYGKEFSLIPVAGSFYFSREMLQGKVYTVQEPRLPFAAVHGDPDVRVPGRTRWGPTARFFPVLEARNWATSLDYFRVSGLTRPQTWISFASILLEPIRFFYLVRNLLFEIPLLGKYFFARDIRKIIPTARGRDFTYARGYGGMRLQRVDTRTRQLLLGEGKITGDNIIFNMTPSPGASVCLFNAMRDAETIATFFKGTHSFDTQRMSVDLCSKPRIKPCDPSQTESYPS